MKQLPDYLTIRHFNKMKDIHDVSTNKGFTEMVSVVMDEDIEDVKKWDINEIRRLFNQIVEKLEEAKPKFHPIIEMDGVVYGFQPPSKMTLGEWIDFEELLKDATNNMEKIMSVLYRPIIKKRWKNPLWRTKYNWKTLILKQSTNPFDVYDVEKYDYHTCQEREDMMLDFPIQAGQGALGFFLVVGLNFLENSRTYLLPETHKMMKMMNEEVVKSLYHNTTDTSSLSTILAKQISLALEEIKQSQI